MREPHDYIPTSVLTARAKVTQIIARDFGPTPIDWKSLTDRDGLVQVYADVRLGGTPIAIEIIEPAPPENPPENPSEAVLDEARYPSVTFVVRLATRISFPTNVLQIYDVLTGYRGVAFSAAHNDEELWIEGASVQLTANALDSRRLRDQIKSMVDLEFNLRRSFGLLKQGSPQG